MTYEEKIAGLESQLTRDMFKDMDIKEEIHRLKLECVGGSCDIDDPKCEACGSKSPLEFNFNPFPSEFHLSF